jgi:hypothetical protein
MMTVADVVDTYGYLMTEEQLKSLQKYILLKMLNINTRLSK